MKKKTQKLARKAPRGGDGPLKVPKAKKGTITLDLLAHCKTKEDGQRELQRCLETFGSADPDFTSLLATQVVNAAPSHLLEDPAQWANTVLAAMYGIGPKDPLEGMLVGQMMAVHAAGMECARRALLEEQTFEGTDANINRMTKMMRTFTAQVEALQKYRNGGKQTVTVQHVNVEDGGQAIVGNVNKGGG